MNRIEDSCMIVEWRWDKFKAIRVQQLIDDWIKENEIFCAETLIQSDRGLIESPNLVADILGELDLKVEWKE